MIKELKFYEGTSRRFEITPEEHKTVNLMLCKMCECTSCKCIHTFSGCIIDSYSKSPIEGVLIEINYGTFRQSEYTNEKGCFDFKLLCCINSVEIRLCKQGFIKRYINVYRLKQNYCNCFHLYRINDIR